MADGTRRGEALDDFAAFAGAVADCLVAGERLCSVLARIVVDSAPVHDVARRNDGLRDLMRQISAAQNRLIDVLVRYADEVGNDGTSPMRR